MNPQERADAEYGFTIEVDGELFRTDAPAPPPVPVRTKEAAIVSHKSWRSESRLDWGRNVKDGAVMPLDEVVAGAHMRTADAAEGMRSEVAALRSEVAALRGGLLALTKAAEGIAAGLAARPAPESAAQKRDRLRRECLARTTAVYFKGGGPLGFESGADAMRRLSFRARRVIRRLGVADVIGLAAVAEEAVAATPNCGVTTLNELRAFLARFGLEFAGGPNPGRAG